MLAVAYTARPHRRLAQAAGSWCARRGGGTHPPGPGQSRCPCARRAGCIRWWTADCGPQHGHGRCTGHSRTPAQRPRSPGRPVGGGGAGCAYALLRASDAPAPQQLSGGSLRGAPRTRSSMGRAGPWRGRQHVAGLTWGWWSQQRRRTWSAVRSRRECPGCQGWRCRQATHPQELCQYGHGRLRRPKLAVRRLQQACTAWPVSTRPRACTRESAAGCTLGGAPGMAAPHTHGRPCRATSSELPSGVLPLPAGPLPRGDTTGLFGVCGQPRVRGLHRWQGCRQRFPAHLAGRCSPLQARRPPQDGSISASLRSWGTARWVRCPHQRAGATAV